ncbi:MAG: T9SS type A sorting domain-containing protein [Sediminibacterium sp.]|nr:T9SS type A sorting domain-containing protein [Sediminibacterium sp.]
MRRSFLLGSALLATISAYPQNGRKPIVTGITNMADRMASRFNVIENEERSNRVAKSETSSNSETPVMGNAKSSAAVTVNRISGSMNIYGMLVSTSKPLQWNDNVNAISFIHRKSSTYSAAPVSNSGAIVAMLSNNMGSTWDSTCIWSNSTNLARYPQGGIYSPPGNTNYNNAVVVGSGPATGGSGWLGNWYASKSVTATPKNTAGSDQQFFSNAGPFTPVGKTDFSRYSFTSTDDGIVRSLGGIYFDANGTTLAAQQFRGAQIVKGTFNAGAFAWSSDSLIPVTQVNPGGSYKYLSSQPIMAWNEQGTVGYVVFTGARTSQTLSNTGYQPIIYKTTNSGASWSLLNGIDFNAPAMQFILDPLLGTKSNTNIIVPFFNTGEGYDAVVDGNNNLHLVSTIVSGYSQHIDSLGYTYNFGTANTSWPFVQGSWPFIYDFVGDGSSAWKAYAIDSMQTEGPSSTSGQGGYSENPWDADPSNSNAKVTSDARIQLSRSVSGDRIAVIWAEGDTSLTSSKWLQFPDLKARLICASNGTISIDPNKTNITSTLPASAINNRVKGKAYFHYVSPKMRLNGNLFEVPVTVTNSSPLSQLTANDHFYVSAEINNFTCLVNIDETKADNNGVSYGLIPNPAKGNATVNVKLINAGTIDVAIYNMVGQVAKTIKTNGEVGENTINVNLEGLSSGVYMVKVAVNGKVTTKKLIVE